jgi:hypothetical protein
MTFKRAFLSDGLIRPIRIRAKSKYWSVFLSEKSFNFFGTRSKKNGARKAPFFVHYK